MSEKPTIPILRALRSTFLDIRSVEDLHTLLDTDSLTLAKLAINPRYHVFEIRKKSGKMRLIEDPDDPLQNIQSTINDYLQAVYWFEKSPAAYGFVTNPVGSEDARHIESNAALHIKRPWLLNCDLLDFFHQVSFDRVVSLLQTHPFQFNSDVAKLLASLCTFKHRTPMGAPTSPVLSNIAFALVDNALLELAHKRGWRYSRYADDMSFSSNEQMTWDDYTDVKRIVTGKFGFDFNEEKAKIFDPNTPKIITGLLLGESSVEVPPTFLPNLLNDIRQLEAAIAIQYKMGVARPQSSTVRFQRSIEGKLQFYRRIMGNSHPSLSPIQDALQEALRPPDDLEMRSWIDFDYI